uniref:hypothetical protein n=1 Tax=Conidiobolus taihushanensis TaxID=2721185 RepID=UPI001D11E786|nr:hypothetical protein LK112_mgp11 [Conidiobolus taihushanensis]QZZ81400.1 hypothetical protein [Conidiobolus taihushanensis]
MRLSRSEKWKRNKTWSTNIYSYNDINDYLNKEKLINKILLHKYKKENWVSNPYYENTGKELQIVLLKCKKQEAIKEKILLLIENIKGLLENKIKLLIYGNIGILSEKERKEKLNELLGGGELEETVIERLKIEEEKVRNLYEEYKKIILLKKDVEEVKELYRKNKEIIKIEEEEWIKLYEKNIKEWSNIDEELELYKKEKGEIERIEKELKGLKGKRRKQNWRKRRKQNIKKQKKRKKKNISKKKKISKAEKWEKILVWLYEYINKKGIMVLKEDKNWIKSIGDKKEIERKENEERILLEEYIKGIIEKEVKIRIIKVKSPILDSKMIGDWIIRSLTNKSFKKIRKDIKKMIKISGMEETNNTYDWNKIKKSLWNKSIRSYIKGIYIQIKGKISKQRRAGRSMKKIFKIGEMSRNNINSLNDNTLIQKKGKNGVYSLKVCLRTIII